MISTLKNLVAPLSEAEFLKHLCDRTVAFVPGADPHRFESLLQWRELDFLITSHHYPVERLSVLRESFSVLTSFYLKDGRFDPAAISSLIDQGANLIFGRLDQYVPSLWRLCHHIAEQTGELITAEATVTSGEGSTLPLHYNKEDICTLQMAGSKRWKLCGSPGINPVQSALIYPGPQSTPFFDEVIQAGDLLFVPAGYWHRSENRSGRSLHVSILFDAPYGRDVVASLASQLAADEMFKQPLTRFADPGALAVHECELKTRLIARIHEWSLTGFLAERAATRARMAGIHLEGARPSRQVHTSD
jgi:hypothetical protein